MKKLLKMSTLKQRFLWVMGLMVVFIALPILIRLVYVQLIRGTAYEQEAYGQMQRDRILHSPRGRIVDRNGEELAVSIMTGALIADPEKMEDSEAMKKKLGQRDARRIAAD